jgi:predicted AlkP superfamily pyrophosphatase or phosphodiesterase
MVTGVDASRHFVIANGLIQHQREQGVDTKVWFEAPKADLVHATTIYDIVHNAGMTTAEVDWVAIHKPGTIDYSFAERPDPDSVVVKGMTADGLVSQEQITSFGKGTTCAWRDRKYTEAASYILRKYHPNLMLLHLLALDGIEHRYGYDTEAGASTIAFLDDRVKDVVEAVREAGDLDRTTFLVVSDHGQQGVHHFVHPEAMLLAAGISKDEARAMPEGGAVYIFEQHDSPELTAKLKSIFEGKQGIRSVFTPDQYPTQGFPAVNASDQSPDLLVYAANDYSFGGGDSGPAVTDTRQIGAHGYPNTEPLMQEIFIASGRRVRPTGEVAPFPNLDIAPTIAALLDVQMNNVQGHSLTQIHK